MSNKKPPKKPKPEPSLTQKERFIEYAKQIGVDETGEEFERALDKVLIKNDSHNTDSVK